MTGLCCRCSVRHDDELCCRHGVICKGDVPGPVESVPFGRDEFGDVELLQLVAFSFVLGAVLAACAWVGFNASDWQKVLAALALVLASIPALRWALRFDEDVERHPAAWQGPGRFRADDERRMPD